MMRFLLAGIVALLPLNTHAESPGCAQAEESELSRAADPSNAEHHADPQSVIEFGLNPNPYHPASPTNFEALLEPNLFVQGQQGLVLYDARSHNPVAVYDSEPDR